MCNKCITQRVLRSVYAFNRSRCVEIVANCESGRGENPKTRDTGALRVSIRDATVEDAAAIAAIDNEYSAEQAREEIGRGISRVCVVHDSDGSVVAWLSAWHVPPHELQIIQITVSPSKRRQGIGRMLLQSALDTYGPSVSEVVLEVREDNMAARALYDKLGFTQLGSVRKNYYADGTGAVCMVRASE